MLNRNGSVYKEQPSLLSIADMEANLSESFVEVDAYRTNKRCVWINLDHVEAVAMDAGKLCQWKFPEGTRPELSHALMKRFSQSPTHAH